MKTTLPTLANIRPSISATTYQRGLEYARARRIRSARVVVDGVVAEIQGQLLYTTFVGWMGPQIDVACSCPLGRDNVVCKHVVALVAAVEDGLVTVVPESGQPPAPEALVPPAATQVLTPLEIVAITGRVAVRRERALLVWAADVGLEGWLRLRAADLPPGAFVEAPWSFRYRTLADIIITEPSKWDGPTERLELAGWLTSQGRKAKVFRAARAARHAARVPPSEPELAVAWNVAVAADLALPPPMLAGEVEGPAQITVSIRPPLSVTVATPTKCWRCGKKGPKSATTLSLESPFTLSQCGDEATSGGYCPIRHETLSALLDVLSPSGGRPEHRVIVDAVAVPAWSRALSALMAEEAETRRYALELTHWPSSRSLTMHLVGVTPKKKGGVSLKRVSAPLTGVPPHVTLWQDLLYPGGTTDTLRKVTLALAEAARLSETVYIAGQPEPFRVEVEPVSLSVLSESGPGETLGIGYSFVGKTSPIANLVIYTRHGEPYLVHIDEAAHRVVLGEISDTVRRFAMRLVDTPPVVVPKEGRAALVRTLVSAKAPLVLPESLSGAVLPTEAVPVLRAQWLRPTLTLQFGVYLHPDYPVLTPNDGPDVLYVGDGGVVAHIDRDLEAEQALATAFAEALEVPVEHLLASPGHVVEPTDLGRVLATLRIATTTGLPGLPVARVDWASKAPTVTIARPESVRVEVSSGRDWFGVSGGITVDGSVIPLSLVLRAIRDRLSFVELDGDALLVLSDRLLEALAPMAAVAVPHGKKRGAEDWRVSQIGAAALAFTPDTGIDFTAPAAFTTLTEKVREAEVLEPELPPNLQATLRPYQRDGFKWLARLAHWSPGASLCDDMGLGKTVQAIALLLTRAEIGPILVVAPTSVGFNWVRELERFAPTLRPRLFRGVATKHLLDGLGAGDVLITNYDLLAYYGDDFLDQIWGTLVLDEAQAIKNATTQRAKVAARLNAGFRLALTGTPIENRTDELWSLFNATVPGLLGTHDGFRERFGNAIERQRHSPQGRLLSRIIRPFVLRRLKSEVARDLPARTDVTVDVDLSDGELALYAKIRHAAIALLTSERSGPPAQVRFQVLTALTRLRQAACHPRLLDPASTLPSSKLAALLGLVDELREEGHRALVFSQFTSHLQLVREALDERNVDYRYLDGSTPAAKRKDEVDAFQRGEGELFLLSLKAGGTGLNLTGADYVIHLDPWWNPAVEDQATDRAHRIGQTRPVTVYRLVARGTIEESILALHADKRSLVATVLDGTGTAAALTTEELFALIDAGAGGPPVDSGAPDHAPITIVPPLALPPAPKRRGRPRKVPGA